MPHGSARYCVVHGVVWVYPGFFLSPAFAYLIYSNTFIAVVGWVPAFPDYTLRPVVLCMQLPLFLRSGSFTHTVYVYWLLDCVFPHSPSPLRLDFTRTVCRRTTRFHTGWLPRYG